MAARAAEAERVALERLPAAFALPAGGGGSAATTKVIMREFVRLSALQEAGRAEGTRLMRRPRAWRLPPPASRLRPALVPPALLCLDGLLSLMAGPAAAPRLAGLAVQLADEDN
eukprot:2717639-Prymnesium_polylepis.1